MVVGPSLDRLENVSDGCRLRAWIVYVLFPDYQDSTSWRRHARIMVFGCIKDKSGKDIQDQLKKQGCESLMHEGFRNQIGSFACRKVQGKLCAEISGHLLHLASSPPLACTLVCICACGVLRNAISVAAQYHAS